MYDLIYAGGDKKDLEIAKRAFEQIGWAHRVLFLHSGKAVLQYLDGLSNPLDFPNLVLLDYHLGGMNGEDLLVFLRSHPTHVGIQTVLFASAISQSRKEHLHHLGAACCVNKPTSLEQYTKLATHLKRISGELATGQEPSFDLLGVESGGNHPA